MKGKNFYQSNFRSCHEIALDTMYSFVDTRLSDFHRMTVTVMRSHFQKAQLKITIYRDYKNFQIMNLDRLLIKKTGHLQNSNDTSLSSFMNVCKDALDKVAPLKQKYIRANNGPFMNEDITKAIMKRTRLRSNYLKIDGMRIERHIIPNKKSVRFVNKKS